MRSFIFSLLLLVGLPCLAQDPFFLDAPSGRYLVFASDEGVPVVVPVGDVRVVDWDGDTDTPDDPPKDPPIDKPDKLASDVARWAVSVGDTDASQRYALIFATVRDAVKDDPSFSIPRVWLSLSKSADAILGDDWKLFREVLTQYNTKTKQEGKLGTRTQILNYLATVKHGLELSANGSDAISLDESLKVIAQVNKILDELK